MAQRLPTPLSRCALFVALVLLACGCNESSADPTSSRDTDTPQPNQDRTVATLGLSNRAIDICIEAQQIRSITVLCPSHLPRASGRLRALHPHLYRLRSFAGSGTAASRVRFHLIFLYGAPSGEGRQRFGPSRFLHFEIAGGSRISRLIGFRHLDSGVDVSLGPVTLAGRSGALYYQRPFPRGGEWGDHYIFQWRQDGTDYYASLHAWASRRAVVRTLSRIVGGPVPADRLSDHRGGA